MIGVRTILLALVSGLALTAQAPQGQPSFKSGVDYVQVDAIVTDSDGRIVRGLRREDFDLLEDGQPREIATFVFVEIPVTTGQRVAPPTVSDVATNIGERRVYVLLLEPLMVQSDVAAIRRTQNAARQFVDEALGANDLMAVILPQGSSSHAQSFTSDRSLLRASIEQLPKSPVIEDRCSIDRIRFSYETIAEVSRRLGAIDGRRKAIVWIGGRVPFDLMGDCGGGRAAIVDSMYADALRAATRNNVAVYPIDPLGLTPAGGAPNAMDLSLSSGLRQIAEDTGGEAVIGTNDLKRAFERIVEDNSSYYMLGYSSPMLQADGAFHAITVRARRAGLTIRARRGYYSPVPDPKAGVASPGGTNELPVETRRALNSALPVSGLGMQMFAVPFKGSRRNGSVVIGSHLRGADLNFDVPEPIEVSHLTIDTRGRVTPGLRKVYTLNLRDKAVAQEDGISYFDRLELPPGRHEVRLVARQVNGVIGSLVTHVDVQDFEREALSMSGIVITSRVGKVGQVLRRDGFLARILNGDPTVQRRFERRDALTTFVEVYTSDRIAIDDVKVSVAVTAASGTELWRGPGVRVASERRQGGYTALLPLTDLTPGERVLTIEAQAGRRTVSRRLAFVVE